MDHWAVDMIIDDIYQARESYNNEIDRILHIGGTNDPPSATVLDQLHELETYRRRIACTGC